MKKMIILSVGVFVLGLNINQYLGQKTKEQIRASELTEKMIDRYESEIQVQKNKQRLKEVKQSYREYIDSVIENESDLLGEEVKERLLDAGLSL